MVELAKRYFLVIIMGIVIIGFIIFYVIIPSKNNEVQLLVNNEASIEEQLNSGDKNSLEADNQDIDLNSSINPSTESYRSSVYYNNKLLRNNISVNDEDRDLNNTSNISEDYVITENKQDNKIIEQIETTSIPVYICGEIKNPGVYEVQSDKLVNDIVILAGGLTQDANPKSINLASKIHANQMIVVPKLGEPDLEITTALNENNQSASVEQNDTDYTNINSVSENDTNKNLDYNSNLININTATKTSLMELPGIGDVKASAIIDYRESIGGFKDISDIKNVSGIGEKTFEKLAKLITI